MLGSQGFIPDPVGGAYNAPRPPATTRFTFPFDSPPPAPHPLFTTDRHPYHTQCTHLGYTVSRCQVRGDAGYWRERARHGGHLGRVGRRADRLRRLVVHRYRLGAGLAGGDPGKPTVSLLVHLRLGQRKSAHIGYVWFMSKACSSALDAYFYRVEGLQVGRSPYLLKTQSGDFLRKLFKAEKQSATAAITWLYQYIRPAA